MPVQISGMSPSAYIKWDFCPQQYYIGYNLKYPSSGNKKATMGTILHKIMEVLGKINKSLKNKQDFIEDDVFGGKYYFDATNWLSYSTLSEVQVEEINKSRKLKKMYKDRPFISKGHTRKGVEFVENIVSLVYTWFTSKYTEYTWESVDYKDLMNWIWMVLDYKDGMYDPRYLNIVSTEFAFEIPLEYDWATYSYQLPDGSMKEGYLKLRGIIDLVVGHDKKTLEVVDFKSGERKDWNTGKVKDYDELKKDTQLLIYYYALKKLFKDVDDIWLTIFFVRDGGPFTIPFDEKDIKKIEKDIKDKFTEIKTTNVPRLLSRTQTHFKCKWCDYSKIDHNGQNLCAAVHESIKLVGIDNTTEQFKQVK